MSDASGESKVVYVDDGKVRVQRGIISDRTEWGITLSRRDGTVEIAWAAIVKIETWNSGQGDVRDDPDF